MKKILCAVILASLFLVAGTAAAQQFGAAPQTGVVQQQYASYPQGAQQQPQYGGQQQPQYGGQQGQAGTLNIPPAPAKPVPNSAYGNNDRAAILGEQLSQGSQGNAKVYVTENPNRTVSVDVKMLADGDPYSMAGTMANLTYMVSNIYSFTELKGSDIILTVYDTGGNVITAARFSDAKNAFDYYNVPQAAATATPVAQPGYQQPGYAQPGYGQPSYSGQTGTQPSYGGTAGGQPSFGYR